MTEKVKKFYNARKSEKDQEKRILLNKKMKIERKREILEEKLILGTLTDDDFVKIRNRFKEELDNIHS